ncbi:hypothetical protein PILCRDRAFT_14754 [Piloderma croceum F 1598]|uniref:2OGFeDO JBP1/TET oxygenase domain-containing protein n=1 Tax=Piloderma croceum (strain F 1598) TaxID=765440 RepID=A0A0C3AJK0_PILCF|nr:hypothetical protein PILCRDRAFT_14754 [Piloderma croceum F 1598]
MSAPVNNPALNLPPEMILGLLQALDNSSNPVVRGFHGLLQLHPVSRASMAISVSPNPPAELCDPSLAKPVSATGLESNLVTESVAYLASVSSASGSSSSAIVQDTSRTNEFNLVGNASGISGGQCCRNGIRRMNVDAPRRRKQPERIVEGEATARRVTRSSAAIVENAKGVAEETTADLRGVAVVDESEFSGSEDSGDDGTGSENESSGRKRKRSGKKGSIKKKKRTKKDPPPSWLTDGSPPELHTGTDSLLIELCRVISNDGLQSLTDMAQHLIRPETCKPTADYSLNVESIIAACSQEDVMQTVTDFRHMMLLIRLAFHLQRELTPVPGVVPTPSIFSIASIYRVKPKSLWNWYSMGSRLIHLAAGAALGLKTRILYRSVTTNLLVDSLAFALRNPEHSSLSAPLVALMGDTLIPQIGRLRNFAPLRSILQYDIFANVSKDQPGCCIDFFDVESMDALFDGFQTNLFVLPRRSDIWSSVLALSDRSMHCSFESLSPSNSVLGELREAILIVTPLILSDNPSPKIQPKQRRAWTKTERTKAESAAPAASIDHLKQLLKGAHEGGKRKQDSYVRITHSIFKGSTLKLCDSTDAFMGLVFSEASDIIRDSMAKLQAILEHADPSSSNLCHSDKRGYSYDSIHFDMYNRFAERVGDGSPDNVHPHFLYRDGNGHGNHNQRATYLAKAIKNNPERYQSITDILEGICKIVCSVLQKHLPDAFDQLRVFCEILPLNHMPVTYPFPGFVLNIRVCTDAHVDANDNTICVVIPFGTYKGGELVLYEAGLVLEIQEGDILIFPSHRLTHFNLHFIGVRGSIVMHSDKEVNAWNVNRNGWDCHMVVKK